MTPAPNNILVKHVNWLGDVVMSQPALRALRRAWPHARISVLIKHELAGFFAGADWIDDVIPYRLRSGFGGLIDRITIVKTLRRRSFDLAILFPDSFDAALWPALAGIPRRVGYARDGRGALLTDAVARGATALAGHQVGYRLHLLERALAIAGDRSDYSIDVGAAQRRRMSDWLAQHRRRPGRPLIAIAAGAAYGPAKQWPAAHYAALIDLLAERDWECVLVGSPSERLHSQEVLRASRSDALLAAGETDVGELVGLLSLCQGFAGNDSGAMHIAGALGITTVGIFGSTRPERTSPLGVRTQVLYRDIECSPCLQRTCRFGHYRCLTEIAPSEVVYSLSRITAGEG